MVPEAEHALSEGSVGPGHFPPAGLCLFLPLHTWAASAWNIPSSPHMKLSGLCVSPGPQGWPSPVFVHQLCAPRWTWELTWLCLLACLLLPGCKPLASQVQVLVLSESMWCDILSALSNCWLKKKTKLVGFGAFLIQAERMGRLRAVRVLRAKVLRDEDVWSVEENVLFH